MSPRARSVLALALALAGVAIGVYLTWTHYAGIPPVCVGGVAGCEVVQSSRFATVGDVPVAAIGVLLYGSIAVLAAAGLRARTLAPSLVLATFGAVLAGVLYSAYLTYLELFVLGAVCTWCVVSAVVLVALLAVVAVDLREATR
ncbi:MAG TPA: vitamin K epoxide reductase family protein [Candidatus Limnocylindria bacterium]|nr:vitamin K epoxide reductase family protein [Candidatus Limnocylindria bacterium]